MVVVCTVVCVELTLMERKRTVS